MVVNAQAYRALALDLDLWSRTSPPVQSSYLAHFSILLHTSKFARFTIKSRLAKVPIVKKLLLAVQLGTFKDEMESKLVDALRVVARAMWGPEVIKAIVAYLAAGLHTAQEGGTPGSTISGIPSDKSAAAQRAELVLDALVSILQSSSAHLTRFTAALPAPRVLLLLLGEHPSSVVAAQMLVLLGELVGTSPSFSRKFELAHGWLVFKTVVPGAWDPSVHVAAFDVLLGRTHSSSSSNSGRVRNVQVSNPVIFPMILISLQRGLQQVLTRGRDLNASGGMDSVMEVLVGEMIELYGSVPTFRLLWKTKTTMGIFVDLYRAFLGDLARAKRTARGDGEAGEGEGGEVVIVGGVNRIEEKLRVLAGLLCENPVVDIAQRQEVSSEPSSPLTPTI